MTLIRMDTTRVCLWAMLPSMLEVLMNKLTRQLVVAQKQIARLVVDFQRLQERGVDRALLLARAKEIVALKDRAGLK